MRITSLLNQRHSDAYHASSVRIACLGDSVTHGCFDVYINRFGKIDTYYDSASSYVRLLQDALFRLFPACAVTVANCGISGDGTSGALPRFDRDVVPLCPDLVTVNLGLNDCMAEDSDIALADYRDNLRSIFSKIHALGAEGMLVTPNRMCAYVDPMLPEGILRDIAAQAAKRQVDGVLSAFVETARDVAREFDAPIADTYAAWQALDRAGVDTTALLVNHINHPAKDMHRLFAQKILEQLF